MNRATQRLLDTARGGRAMAWVIAIMLFLTVLATAAGLGTARATGALGTRLKGRATLIITTLDPARRDAEAARALAALESTRGVVAARLVPPAEIARLIGPALGDAADDPDLPMPAMIDLELARTDAVTPVRAAVAATTTSARLDLHRAALAPVSRLLSTLTAVAFTLVALMAAATTAVVVLAARAGLDANRGTIETVHMLGATDVQVARLFQRRLTRDAALGALIGAVPALALVMALGIELGQLGSELLGGAGFGWQGWGVLAAIPFLFIVVASLAARVAVVRQLGRRL